MDPWRALDRHEALSLLQFEREQQAAEARRERLVRRGPGHSSRPRPFALTGRLLVRLGRALAGDAEPSRYARGEPAGIRTQDTRIKSPLL